MPVMIGGCGAYSIDVQRGRFTRISDLVAEASGSCSPADRGGGIDNRSGKTLGCGNFAIIFP